MNKLLLILFITTINVLSNAQTLKTQQCEKPYKNHQKNTYYTDESPEVYGHEELFSFSACSWACYPSIMFQFSINNNLDTTLTDGSVKSCLISDSKEINSTVYLQMWNLMDTTDIAEDTIILTGFLISNGNRTNRVEYLKYSRVKSMKISINDSLIGTAVLLDTPKVQYVDFGKRFIIDYDKRHSVTIEVIDLYNGLDKRYSIAEIWFDGYGGHSLTPKMCYGK